MAAEAAALAHLTPRERAFVEEVLQDHPSLSNEEALAVLREAGR